MTTVVSVHNILCIVQKFNQKIFLDFRWSTTPHENITLLENKTFGI